MRKCIIIPIIVFHWSIISWALPTLTFECSPEGLVANISGVDIQKLVWDNKGQYCHMSEKNCTWQKQQTIRIFYDENEVNPRVVAARHPHFYELDCKNEFDLSPTAQPIAIGSVGTQTSITHLEQTKPTITLTILKGSTQLNETVSIGEQLNLEMKVDGNYKVDPKICSASDGKTQPEYTLWNSSNCTSNDQAIMDHNWNLTLNNSKASIPFYAFKFVDSDTVMIKCTAHVYPASNTKYKELCPKHIDGRRRRSVTIETRFMSNMKDESATASFTIRHVISDINSSAGLSMSLMLYMSAVGASIGMMKGV